MKFSEYQERASASDVLRDGVDSGPSGPARVVPLLGLVGEVGTLLTEYKKILRDGPEGGHFLEVLQEELGDVLWYVSTIATRFDLRLEEVAASNLRKVQDRWLGVANRVPFDEDAPEWERLPRSFSYRVVQESDGRTVRIVDGKGEYIGDPLTDNAHKTDGYRFHDVMHFSFVAVLGWSPVARKLLRTKRKYSNRIDEIEDGGRASVIDEAIVAMIFDHIHHDLSRVDSLPRIDSDVLRSIRTLTRGFEVHARSENEWESAILQGLRVWRDVEAANGGIIVGDFARGSFEYRPLAD